MGILVYNLETFSHLNYMNKWFQEGSPSSYKIQVLYVDIPEHLKLKQHAVDTPFRYRSHTEAQKAAQDLFNGYNVKIVGSNDKPHWQVPEARVSSSDLQKEQWYDVYGVTPAYQVNYQRQKGVELQESVNDPTFQNLLQLKPQATSKNVRSLASETTQQKQQKQQKRCRCFSWTCGGRTCGCHTL